LAALAQVMPVGSSGGGIGAGFAGMTVAIS